MAKTFRVKFAEVEVDEDSYEAGEGAYVNSWDMSIKGKTFSSLEEIVKAASNEDYVFSDNKENWVYMDGRLLTDATVNEDGDKPYEDELEQWKQGNLMLYVAHLDIGVEVYDEVHDLTEEEAEAEGFYIY